LSPNLEIPFLAAKALAASTETEWGTAVEYDPVIQATSWLHMFKLLSKENPS
jgi:hypothetical protein